MSCNHRFLVFGLAALLLTAAPAFAQGDDHPQGSTTAPGRSSADKGFVEKARDWAKDNQLVERMQGDVDGWYPRLGGLKRGAGFGAGPGYRTHLLGDGTPDSGVLLDVSGAMSYRMYKAIDVRARWIEAFDKRFELWTDYRFEDDPQEDFFGIGFDSPSTSRTSYTYRGSDLSLRAALKPVTWLRTGASVGYLNPSVHAGRDPGYPSIEERFTDAAAPALVEQPNYLHATLFADAEFRDVPGNPRRGGFYHVGYGSWNDRSFDAYTFRRFEANAIQHVPLDADQRHILSPRVGIDLVNNAPGDRVPFFFLPYVGGADTIRSLREFRFEDENALWLGAEYRWIATKWVSLAAFTDAGKVTHGWDQMDLTGLKHAYGFGFLVHSSKQTFMRLYFATGANEGVRTTLRLGLF